MSGEKYVVFRSDSRSYMLGESRKGFSYKFLQHTIEISIKREKSAAFYVVLDVPESVGDLDSNREIRFEPVLKLLSRKVPPIPGIWIRFVARMGAYAKFPRAEYDRVQRVCASGLLSPDFKADNVGHLLILACYVSPAYSGIFEQLLMSEVYNSVELTSVDITKMLLLVAKCLGATCNYPVLPVLGGGTCFRVENILAEYLKSTLNRMEGMEFVLLDMFREWSVPAEYRNLNENVRFIWSLTRLGERASFIMDSAWGSD